MRKLSAQLFLRSPRSTDRLVPAVVWERDDQRNGPSGGRATPVAGGDGVRPPLARVRLPTASAQPGPGHRARRPASRALLGERSADNDVCEPAHRIPPITSMAASRRRVGTEQARLLWNDLLSTLPMAPERERWTTLSLPPRRRAPPAVSPRGVPPRRRTIEDASTTSHAAIR